jgi:hypothetical protein
MSALTERDCATALRHLDDAMRITRWTPPAPAMGQRNAPDRPENLAPPAEISHAAASSPSARAVDKSELVPLRPRGTPSRKDVSIMMESESLSAFQPAVRP